MKKFHTLVALAIGLGLSLGTAAAADPKPAMTGTWSTKDGKTVIEIQWTALTPNQTKGVDHLRISGDIKSIGNDDDVTLNLPVTATSYTVEVPKPDRSYRFELHASNAAGGNAGLTLATQVLAPGRTLLPASLLRVAVADPAKGQIACTWKYADSAKLKGYRIYVDGKLAADETVLPNSATTWTTGTLASGDMHTFEIEGVGANGEITERGPKCFMSIPKQ